MKLLDKLNFKRNREFEIFGYKLPKNFQTKFLKKILENPQGIGIKVFTIEFGVTTCIYIGDHDPSKLEEFEVKYGSHELEMYRINHMDIANQIDLLKNFSVQKEQVICENRKLEAYNFLEVAFSEGFRPSFFNGLVASGMVKILLNLQEIKKGAYNPRVLLILNAPSDELIQKLQKSIFHLIKSYEEISGKMQKTNIKRSREFPYKMIFGVIGESLNFQQWIMFVELIAKIGKNEGNTREILENENPNILTREMFIKYYYDVETTNNKIIAKNKIKRISVDITNAEPEFSIITNSSKG